MLGRRPDGYHLLDSLAVFASLADTLTARAAPALSLAVEGPFAKAAGAGEDNLVLRAARAFDPPAGPRVALHLAKNIPVAAGLGGGSSDAAATLRLLARMTGTALPGPAVATSLGADVPVCLAAEPALMSGIGEVLNPVPALPCLGLVLANPHVPLSTPAVFSARTGAFDSPAVLPAGWADADALAAWLRPLRNALEAPAIALCPPVAAVLAALAQLKGALLARMSGSGPTCFALMPDAAAAIAAAEELARDEHGWWIWGGGLYRGGVGGL